jgi:hypothetical protein
VTIVNIRHWSWLCESFVGKGVPNFLRLELGVCTKSAKKSPNPAHAGQTPCQSAMHRRVMGKIIIVQFRRPRLPRRLLDDGWWLETPPAPSSVIALPKRSSPKDQAKPTPKVRHLTLITPGK